MVERDEERERLVQAEPEVLEGDDAVPRQPVRPVDEYAVEPKRRPGERRAWAAMRLSLIPLAILVLVLLVWGFTR